MKMELKWAFCFVIINMHLAMVFCTPCSMNERNGDDNACLLAMKGQLFNTSAYWFGTQYPTDCPSGATPNNFFCANPRSGEEDSLALRLFPNNLDHGLIDRFLEVKYSYGTDSYTGCGVTVNEPAWEKDIDPLSDEPVTPWNTRLMPDLKFNSSDSEYFTIVFINVGYLVTHAVYVNVRGNTITQNNVIQPYTPPFTPILRRQPFMFLVFKQTSSITVSQAWIDAMKSNSSSTFNVEDFAQAYSLTGPVALNWISVVGDVYSAGLADRSKYVHSCPQFVSRAMDSLENRFLPKPADLTVSVDVEFHAPALDFRVCCQDLDYAPVNFTANPFADPGETVFTGTVRTEAELTFSFRKMGYYANSQNFNGELLTLVNHDPDTTSVAAGNRDRPILHQLIVNIRDGDVSTGDVVASYVGPNPPDPSVHNYWFVLYKQQGLLNATEMTSYAGSCPTIPRLVNRCLFNINQLVRDNNLTLLGANVIRSTYDEYVKFRRLDQNDTDAVNVACRSVPGFVDPTCTRTTTTTEASDNSAAGFKLSAVIITCLLSIFMAFV